MIHHTGPKRVGDFTFTNLYRHVKLRYVEYVPNYIYRVQQDTTYSNMTLFYSDKAIVLSFN